MSTIPSFFSDAVRRLHSTRGDKMPPKQELSAEQVKDLASYLKSIRP